MAQRTSFKYVYIPADLDEPLQELELAIPEGREVECLMDHLKVHFNATGTNEQQREARKKALLEQLGNKAANLDPKMLALAADMQMVENISLLANHRDVGHVGVNMYTDDHAQAKNLPLNLRASSLADTCGKMIQVKGDAFLARIFDDEDRFERLDFTLSDVSSSAPWVVEAKRQAVRRQGQPDAQTMFQQVDAGATAAKRIAAPPPKSEAEQAKEAGNDAVKRGDWATAEAQYTRALELQPGLLAAVSNRALVRLKLGQLEAAVQDCNTVLAAEPGNVKALLRRAAAEEGQGAVEAAVQDYQQVLRLQAVNKEAAAALDRLQPPPAPTADAAAPVDS